MEKDLISVNIAVFNGEKFLAESIESLLNQTDQNFEIVICDDASTDGTQLILEQYQAKDKRIKVIRHEINKGAAAAFNTAAMNSSGEFIATMSSDDICYPNRLEIQRKVMEENPQVDILGAEMSVFADSLSSAVNQNFFPTKEAHIDIVRQLEWFTSINHVTMFARKRVYNLVQYNEKFRAAIDYDFMLRAKDCNFVFKNISPPLVYCRIHKASLGSSKRGLQLRNVYIAKELYLIRKIRQEDSSDFDRTLSEIDLFSNIFLNISSGQRISTRPHSLLRFFIAPFSKVGRFFLRRKLCISFNL